MPNFVEISGSQTRQLIDIEQRYLALRDAERELAHDYPGSMTWKRVGSGRYLYRKHAGTGGRWQSMGPETPATLQTHAAFHERRDALRRRTARIDQDLRAAAPVARAMRLGRVPRIAARILRRLDAAGVLGAGISIVGTHALYAYERLAGVQFDENVTTTRDVNLLYEAPGGLGLLAGKLGDEGLLGLLRRVDASFAATRSDSFRAVNDSGFMVDLITPMPRAAAVARLERRSAPDDGLLAVEITGLAWLENVPAVTVVTLDEAGYPLILTAPDPRAFACHKAWLAQRDDRAVEKRRRDAAQAAAVAQVLATYLPDLRFDAPELSAVPAALRAAGAALARPRRTDPPEDWR